MGVCAGVTDNALRIEVEWTTEAPGSSWVAFGEGELTSILGDETATLDHRVVLYGLHADTEIDLQVRTLFGDETEQVSEIIAVRTGQLPEYVIVGVVESHDPTRAQPGWTLLNTNNRNAHWPGVAVIYDEGGQPVWYHASEPNRTDGRGDIDVSLTPDFTILLGGSGKKIDPVEVDLSGEVVWRGPPQVDPIQHHDIEKLADGSYIQLRHAKEGTAVNVDLVIQMSADHSPIWTWNALDHISAPDDAKKDFTHCNSVTVTDDAVYVSSRGLDALYKVDRSNGEIVWRLGSGGTFALEPGDLWFRNQHDPELQSDGSWLIFDNDGAPGAHSRVIQIAIDEAAETAQIVWAFPGSFAVDPWYTEDWHSAIWGDADRLQNGNVLITAATRTEGEESRIFEVTPDGEVVWTLRLPTPNDSVVGSYRAQRLPEIVAKVKRSYRVRPVESSTP